MTEQVVTEDGEVVAIDKDVISFGDDALTRIAYEAESRVEAMKTIMMAALRLTNYRDWVIHGSGDKAKPYMCSSGAEKIAAIGVTVSDITRTKIVDDDEKGRYYIWEYVGKFSIAGRSIEAVGTCTSRDKFFALREGELLPLGDVPQDNIMKAAYSNCMVNGISRLLGFRSVTFEELAAAQINREALAKVEYAEGGMGKDTEGDPARRKELGEILNNLAGGDIEEAKAMLVDITEFTNKDDKLIKGLRTIRACKGTRLRIALEKARDLYKQAHGKDYVAGGEPPKEEEKPKEEATEDDLPY